VVSHLNGHRRRDDRSACTASASSIGGMQAERPCCGQILPRNLVRTRLGSGSAKGDFFIEPAAAGSRAQVGFTWGLAMVSIVSFRPKTREFEVEQLHGNLEVLRRDPGTEFVLRIPLDLLSH
jgi:hypothetical protein